MNHYSLKYISQKSVTQFINDLGNKVQEIGFEVMIDLNLSEKYKNALKIEFDDYRILGLCNPKLSHEIITQEKGAGLFLPCKIVVYKDQDTTKIEFQRPTYMSDFFYSKHIESVTERVEELLDSAIKSVV
ncbi:MAG: DUF302 domain-containing protein [Candidatus Marinimicrobia bacterium]|nr:DUF302 domain-containing protein [Candidatus Neomarinimicrobiota bacterium]